MEVEACDSEVRSGFRAQSSISKSETSALIDLETKFVEKAIVEPLAMVDLGLSSNCKLTDYRHVRHILTRIDGKVEKHIVTLSEEKGEITFVDGGHDVEHVTASRNITLLSPHQPSIEWVVWKLTKSLQSWAW